MVSEVRDSNTAFRQAQVPKPDVVSIDVKMPNVDIVEHLSAFFRGPLIQGVGGAFVV